MVDNLLKVLQIIEFEVLKGSDLTEYLSLKILSESLNIEWE